MIRLFPAIGFVSRESTEGFMDTEVIHSVYGLVRRLRLTFGHVYVPTQIAAGVKISDFAHDLSSCFSGFLAFWLFLSLLSVPLW